MNKVLIINMKVYCHSIANQSLSEADTYDNSAQSGSFFNKETSK